MSVQKECLYCGKSFEAKRVTGRYCSSRCSRKYLNGSDKERDCNQCGKVFEIITRADANRRYCSKNCSKKAGAKKIMDWKAEHPNAMKGYNENRKKKHPTGSRDEYRNKRLEIVELLGGECIVCGVLNPSWLHIDYIPTTRDKPYRHPRHYAYVSTHLNEFRLLCANHHYELTLTGKIEGTTITQ